MDQTAANKAAQEHIEWMEANKASACTTAEHFGVTRVEFHRELIRICYVPKEWFRWTDDDPSTIVFYRPFMHSTKTRG